jgi:nicotinamide riboside kinase|tara:strand:- start:27 stop:575 length:549 start_codon:yes stop_codon:yes gene_type:complete
MLISFTGVQSSGKSTLLEKMKLDGDFRTYDFVPEITRRLKKQYNLNINEDGDEFTQLAILNSHVHNYLTYRDKNAVLDRCILDGFLYTTYMFYQGKVPEALVLHSSYLFEKLIKKYDILFYTEPDIPLKDDGERSTNVEFRNKMVELFDEAIDHYKLNVVRLKGSINERYKTILNTVNNYGK